MQTVVLFAIRRRPLIIQRRLQRLMGVGTAYITEAFTFPDGSSVFPGGFRFWEEIYDEDLPICALDGYDILYKTASLAGPHSIFRRKKASQDEPASKQCATCQRSLDVWRLDAYGVCGRCRGGEVRRRRARAREDHHLRQLRGEYAWLPVRRLALNEVPPAVQVFLWTVIYRGEGRLGRYPHSVFVTLNGQDLLALKPMATWETLPEKTPTTGPVPPNDVL